MDFALALCDDFFNRQINHPPPLLKNIAIPPYQKALDESAYTCKLTYNPQAAQKRNKNRQRRVIWYNRMKTNFGRRFLNIVDRCFPKNHPLHKIFNRHTLKLIYSCRPNMKTIISSHNK